MRVQEITAGHMYLMKDGTNRCALVLYRGAGTHSVGQHPDDCVTGEKLPDEIKTLRQFARKAKHRITPSGTRWTETMKETGVDKAADARREMNSPHSGTKHRMLKYFRWEHLPEQLQNISRPFGELAVQMLQETPAGPEQTAGLRKLLEAKDCIVRAALED